MTRPAKHITRNRVNGPRRRRSSRELFSGAGRSGMRLRQSTCSLWPTLVLVTALAAGFSCMPSKAPSLAQTDLTVQVVNNLLYVPVRVGGSEPLSFILDTGASATVLSR